jgi:transcriptional regulator with XRE-family HTH domain
MAFLRRLGERMRSRRLYIGKKRGQVATDAEISVTQLSSYESGQGHPPAATLHRIARTLGVSSSALLGEVRYEDDERLAVEAMMKDYADPVIGGVVRHMQHMTVEDRKSLQLIAAGFVRRWQPPEKVEVMQ